LLTRPSIRPPLVDDPPDCPLDVVVRGHVAVVVANGPGPGVPERFDPVSPDIEPGDTVPVLDERGEHAVADSLVRPGDDDDTSLS
jgi:hypothetical protein